MKRHCLICVTLYCAIFTWMAIPFVMTDDALLRSGEVIPLDQSETVAPRLTVTAQADIPGLASKIR
jgi:hypothetical protein